MTYEITLHVPDSWWMSANDRPHWAQRWERTQALRHSTRILARDEQVPRLDVVQITAFIQYPRNGRADPTNASPTVKAMVDGLVDAGVVPDDDHHHVLGPDYRRDPGKCVRGSHRVRLVITPQEVD